MLCTLALSLVALMLLSGRNARLHRQLEQERTALDEEARSLQSALAQRKAALQQLEQLDLRLQRRLRVVNRLNDWHQFWMRLPTLLPDALWLTQLEKRDAVLMLEGRSRSVGAVRDFRLQLAALPLFTQVRQGDLSRQPEGDYRFVLRASVQEAP